MPDYSGRYEGNGDGFNDFSSSPQEKGGIHAVIEDTNNNNNNDSKSQHDSREKRSSKSRERERGRDKDRERERDRDRERDKDHERSHRDHYRERSDRRDRGRDRDDDDYPRSRDYDRRRDYDRDRESRHRHRSRSPSRGKSAHRSRSRSRSRSKSKRISGFDMAPPASAMLAGAAALAGQITGTPPAIPGMFPNMFPLASGQFGALPVMPVQAMTQQATRHARRVYVGGLSPTANEQSVATFFSQVMAAIGGNTAGPGDAVVNVYINHEKKFAFVEMRSVEEASNAMALDGIIFEGAPVKVRRPSDYNPSLAAALGPSQPNPNLNLAAVGLTPGSAGGLEGPDRIFVGGLPYYFTESQIRELLESFGPLRGFDLVKDRETGNSNGCELIQKILVRLPVKSLGQFKMVSKSWCALIESPFFIDLHTTTTTFKYILLASLTKYLPNNTSSRENLVIMISSESVPRSGSVDSVSSSSSGGCLWCPCSNPDHDDQLVFKVDNNHNNNNSGGGQQQLVFKLDGLGFPKFGDFSKSVVDLGLPSAFKLIEFTKTIVGSCNGLVCLYDRILNEVSLWNPATGQFKILPIAINVVKDDLPKRLVGFGFDVETKDYKVMLLTSSIRSDSYYRSTAALPIKCICQVQIYSLSSDSWRLLEGTTSLPGYPFFSYPSEVVCQNGSCFFLANFFHTKRQRCIAENDRFIISFDFTKEIFTPMQLPDHHRRQNLYLSCLGDDKMALFTVCCNPPPLSLGFYPYIYELSPPRANYSYYPEIYERPLGIDYSEICNCEDYNIWVLDEHVTRSSSSVNKASWRQLRSFQIEHQRPDEWSSPSCILNDGEFVLLETRNSNGSGKKMKLYNSVTKEVKMDFLSCSRVMSKAYAYKPSLVKLMVGNSQQHATADRVIGNGATNL